MDRGKNKADVRHIASQPFSPSLSKRFFSPPFPSIQKSSINSYLNGTPVNNRRQALEMWVRLKLICRECYLVQQFFVNYKVATARQLRISKGGTMGRMNLSQRSHSNKPCSTGKCVRVYIPALRIKGSKRTLSYAFQRSVSIRQFIIICESLDHMEVAGLTYSSDFF